MAQPLLEVADLSVRFDTDDGFVHAVDRLSFTLEAGEVLGIVGESGCGKSVTCMALVRLLPETAVVSGRVMFDGIDLLSLSSRRLRHVRGRQISYVFQEPMTSLNPVFTIGRQIGEVLRRHLGLSRSAARARALELLRLVRIPAPERRLDDYPHQLSGGMRQRAMIAMALACDPAIVIGDEPTTALDVMVQAQILELLERLREQLGLSLILITHDLSVIAETCDRVMVMYAGRVAEEGPVRTVFSGPRHPYTQMLLAAIPNLDSDKRLLGTIPGSPPDLRTPPPGCRFHPRCPLAMDVCREEVPEEVRHADGVRVACHLYPPGGDGARRPIPIVEVTGADAAPAGDFTPASAGELAR